jgi:hypothetical protein
MRENLKVPITKTGTLYLTSEEFEWRGMEKLGWQVGVIYQDEMAIDDDTWYFYSPDGIGRVWYDTLEQMLDECGLVDRYSPIVRVINAKKLPQ